jgi:hypothetical protein
MFSLCVSCSYTLKGQSAKCVEGPIRIIVQNFRHFEDGGHSCCAKFFTPFIY